MRASLEVLEGGQFDTLPSRLPGGPPRYLSCFSGIGGLEASTPPLLYCEVDEVAAAVLARHQPSIELHPDVTTLAARSDLPEADVVAGGWPCQDISVAGGQAGLMGLRSRLLLDMLDVAVSAGAHTVVAENVTNLLRMRGGGEFGASLEEFHAHGYPFVGWRVLNAREFGLPQHRSRLILIASKHRRLTYSLFRRLPALPREVVDPANRKRAAGFYWTAGTHSLNYSRGYLPTIKIGSSLGIASPPAVHYGEAVRTISAQEALALQGFDMDIAVFPSASSAYKAAGNAVARPIGRWVMDGVLREDDYPAPIWGSAQGTLWSDYDAPGKYPDAGVSFHSDGGSSKERATQPVAVIPEQLATNLHDYLDLSSKDRLSARASRGLLRRLERSGQPCPSKLRASLERLAAENER